MGKGARENDDRLDCRKIVVGGEIHRGRMGGGRGGEKRGGGGGAWHGTASGKAEQGGGEGSRCHSLSGRHVCADQRRKKSSGRRGAAGKHVHRAKNQQISKRVDEASQQQVLHGLTTLGQKVCHVLHQS